jgi:hypothetical protein
MACTGMVGAADINIGNNKRVGKATVVINLPYNLDSISVFLSRLLLLVSLLSEWSIMIRAAPQSI